MNNLDELLAQPLAKINDENFSKQVLKRINRYYFLRNVILKILTLLLIMGFIISAPFSELISKLKPSKAVLFNYQQLDFVSFFQLNLNNNLLIQFNASLPLIITTLVLIFIIKSPD